ncbi:MAG: hypothetical protein ACRC7N_10080 [Clostridium sp.]
MKKILLIGVLFTFMIFVGCSSSLSTLEEEEKKDTLTVEQEVGTSSNYLEGLGYDVINYNKTIAHSISKENVNEYETTLIWELQSFNINDYLDKEIGEYSFTVKNHPLDKLKSNESQSTKISVFVFNDNVIGGYSQPASTTSTDIYSIDGRTPTQVFNSNKN